MKILFWLNGSNGYRREREIREFNFDKSELPNRLEEVKEALEDWKEKINCHSGCRWWGWDENFNPETQEPLTKH